MCSKPESLCPLGRSSLQLDCFCWCTGRDRSLPNSQTVRCVPKWLEDLCSLPRPGNRVAAHGVSTRDTVRDSRMRVGERREDLDPHATSRLPTQCSNFELLESSKKNRTRPCLDIHSWTAI